MMPLNLKTGITLAFLLLCIVACCQIADAGNLNRLNVLKRLTPSNVTNRSGGVVHQDFVYSCLTCPGGDCESGEETECTTSSEEDQRCYAKYDEVRDIVGMGCVSDFEVEKDIIELVKKQLLWVCQGSMCNMYKKLPTSTECAKCTSTESENCATKPELIANWMSCNKSPYTNCYQRVDQTTGGVTQRGCLSDLEPEDFYDCYIDENNENCKVCEGDNCNNEIVPSSRRKCYRCDSTTDSDCEASPTALSVCPVYNENDSCVSVYKEGITTRGCSSDLQCDSNDSNCQVCRRDGCNDANLKSQEDDLYGIFQDLPLNCYTCEGDECTSDAAIPHKCQGNINQDCLTVFNEAGDVISRGCELLVLEDHEDHCSTNPELCFNCKSNGCNTMTDPSKSVQCLYCDAKRDPDCLFSPESLTNTRRCVEGCVTALYKRKSNPSTLDFVRTCFEDIEPDDRDACTAENNCVKCTEDKCNDVILPAEGRLSCWHCNGNDCNLPQQQECIGFMPHDQCYAFVDNATYSVVRMGCKSDLKPEDLLESPKQYFICDGDNCNSYENLPEANLCFSCNSADDERCAISPSEITAKVRCQVHPFTECLMHINKDGHTVRGCFYDLPNEDFVKCKNGDPSVLCKLCVGSDCNNLVYPSGRQQCYRCDSKTDPTCEAAPSTTQSCPLYQSNDGCVTKLIDGITHRACLSEINCEDSDHKRCDSCEKNNCNTANLIDTFIGDPGRFQSLPLNCYHCDDEEDCADAGGIVKKCEGDQLQTCTTAFNKDGKVIGRGCSGVLDKACGDSDTSCYDCKSNGCNTVEQETDFIDCVFCDARQNEDCVFNVDAITRRRQCNAGCVTAGYKRSEDSGEVYELTRTCLDDMDLDDREACLNGNKAHCKACAEADCNTDDLIEHKSCYQCVADECQAPESKPCRAIDDHEQCFVQYDETGSVVEMGCKSQYDQTDLNILIRAKQIWLCDAENCNEVDNVPASQSCLICNSRTDAACAIDPDIVSATTTCAKQPYTQCYSFLRDDGHTERGCLSSLEDDEFYDCLIGSNKTKCDICVGATCNNQIYPEERLSCHVCNSNSSPDCEKSPDSSKICLKHFQDQKCVSTFDGNGQTIRGCSGDVRCTSTDSTLCEICESSDCNQRFLKRKADADPGKWQQLPIACYSCDGVEECASVNEDAAKTCHLHEYCMTVFDEDGKVQQRGCSDAVEAQFANYCDENSDFCHNCNSNNCNNAVEQDDYISCVYCDSKKNPDCIDKLDLVSGRRQCNSKCMTALHFNETDSAYALVRSCLDDKDLDDQQSCEAGDEHCVACDSADDCNTDILPKERLSCYVCSDDDCSNAATQSCPFYKENDECYILFDGKSTWVQMGCLSDLDDKFIDSNKELMIRCDDDKNCNSPDKIPSTQQCVECDSSKNSDCATNPEHIDTLVTCNALPNTQCYTRVNNGYTVRGCVNSLSSTQMTNCLSGDLKNCMTCIGDNCNNKIYPENRRSCHRCNSKEDPACEASPDASTVCPFYTENEVCSAKYVNGVTYRDCGYEFTCNVDDRQKCRMCNDDNCNAVNLAKLQVGQPGKWQQTPINCYHCSGKEECSNEDAGAFKKCSGNDLQNCVTVFETDGSILMRGCSDQVYEMQLSRASVGDYCDENPEYCKFCNSNGCNTAASLDDFVDCISCDSEENSDCLFNVAKITHTRSCHKHCMTGLYPRVFFDDNPTYVTARGCLDDLDLDDRQECENGSAEKCVACSEENCNTENLLLENRLECFTCEGESCKAPVSQQCKNYRENDQCFILFDEDVIERYGCASDFDGDILRGHRRHIILCDGDNCNNGQNLPKPIACNICNSTREEDCATNPEGSVLGAVCQDLPYSQCFTRVGEDGSTRRGCLMDLSDDEFDKCLYGDGTTCEICDANNCNRDVFPSNRRTCNRCNSLDNSDCTENALKYSSICPIYNADENCVTMIENSHVYRGCSSEMSCNAGNSKTCRTCSSDNCNVVDLLAGNVGEPGKWQGLPLNCYVCEGEECTDSIGTIRMCQNNLKQNCITVFGADDKVVRRDCSDSIEQTYAEHCDENPDKCFECKSSGCNDAIALSEYTDCYFCDSADSMHCSVYFSEATRNRKCHGQCMVALYPRTNVDDPAYEMSRSCLDDMDLDDREKCINGDIEFCKACEGSLCNTMSLPETQRHECYKCSEGDCEDFESKECNAYHPNDQCYLMYNKNNDIEAMGCRSEYEMDDITELIKEKRIVLCDGVNCNKPDMVQPKTCLVCDSAENPLCATNPNLLETQERCTVLPYTDCFVRINEDGHTVRGCVSSLEANTFYGCLNNSDSLCQTCDEDNCNGIDVFPSNRMRCHQCDSSNSALCDSTPDSNRVCPIYDSKDTCVSNLWGDVTYRSCSSSMRCKDDTDKRNCRYCNTAGCNTVDLKYVSEDGEPGRYQDVPLNCHVCDGESECEDGSTYQICDFENPYQSCMTVFNVAGKVVQRGCSEPVETANEEWCSEKRDNCLRCNSNGCNDATSLDDYVECVACDSKSNPDCLYNVDAVEKTRKCHRNCMVSMFPRDKDDEYPANYLERTCYDDMDLDDREACAEGDKDLCEVCDGAKCNVEAMPLLRLSCYQCTGDDCQAPEAKECPLFRKNDLCYLLYDEQRSIVSMGCRSEFHSTEADYLLKQKRLFLCNGANCNTVDAVPPSHQCKICSSRTDIACAQNPESLQANVVCNTQPFSQCYSRVLSDGSTERGCLSNLYDDEFLKCFTGTAENCRSCLGDACNTDIYPQDRTQCHICDSSNDANCESAPDSLAICPKYDAEDSCFTSYNNGLTRRGCSSSATCSGTCSQCQGNGCNTVNLAQSSDDNYGKWQDLPLKCLTCSSVEECSSESSVTAETCELNNQQDCVTVFDEEGRVMARGCQDAITMEHGAYCSAGSGRCFNCKSNECNTAESADEFVDCVYCDSAKDLNCLLDVSSVAHKTRKCQGGCMSALYPGDSSSEPGYELIRTCLNDKEKSAQNTCTKGSDNLCVACEDDECNVGKVPENRLSCLTCVNEDCENPHSQLCPLYKADDQCFIWFDESNSVSEMGCLSSFRIQELETIIKTRRVYVCDEGDDCNQLENVQKPQKCAACDSSSNEDCAVSPRSVGTLDECNNMPYTGCYMKLNSDGTTSRGCVNSLNDDNFVNCVLNRDEHCAVCNGDGCNREVYPADRQQCYTCTSLDDASCESDPEALQPCSLVSDSITCKTALNHNETVRGCSNSILCDSQDPWTCRSCATTGCNAIDLRNKVDDGYHGMWQELPLRCHTCEGEHCQHSLGPAYECSTKNVQQDCMTVFGENDTIVRRGCSDDVEDYEDRYCRNNPHLCFKCKSNECNSAWSLNEYVDCIFCDSTNDLACITSPGSNALEKRRCNKECMVAMKDGDLIRSCLDDKDIFTQYVCREGADGDECASCNGATCNNFNYPKDRLSCHVCTDNDCKTTKSEACTKYVMGDNCFAKFENGSVDIMGCASSQDSNDLAEWEYSRKLYRCAGNDCNSFDNLPTGGTCLSCDSSKTPQCAQDPSNVLVGTIKCPAPYNNCVTRIDKDGNTLRGCLHNLSDDEIETCENSELCGICFGNSCNSNVFPEGRTKCHICKSTSEDNCRKDPDYIEICPVYKKDDTCVSIKTDDFVQRGCGSELSCNTDDEDNCEVCLHDGCNTKDMTGAGSWVTSSVMPTMLLAVMVSLKGLLF